jgi:hypothetical protein
MIQMKELQDAFLSAVAQRVIEIGFIYRAAEQAFLRSIPGGRACLHLALIKHRTDFDAVADVAVRFDQLEDLINASNSLLSKREKGQTYSLGAEIGNISGDGQRRWSVASLADVETVADQVVTSFKEVGLPYLDRASTLEGALRLLTSPGRDAWLHSPIHASRLKRVVGLVKVMGRVDELEARAREGALLLEEIKDPGLLDFKRFVVGLGIKA